MVQSLDAAVLLTLRAAEAADRGNDTTREFAAANVYATEMAVEVTNESLQLHGGVGFSAAEDGERYLRDSRLLTIAGGPNAVHRDALADAVFSS